MKAPSSLPSNNRIRPTELTEDVIAGTLTAYKFEADGDIHLIVTDTAGRTVISELEDPRCVMAARFKTEISNVRRAFLAATHRPERCATRAGPSGCAASAFRLSVRQTGVAPNSIELHRSLYDDLVPERPVSR